jgi:hypothetical protein
VPTFPRTWHSNRSKAEQRALSHARAKKHKKKKIPPSALGIQYWYKDRKKEKEGESFSSPFYAEIRFFYAERRLSFFLRRGPCPSHLRPYAFPSRARGHCQDTHESEARQVGAPSDTHIARFFAPPHSEKDPGG